MSNDLPSKDDHLDARTRDLLVLRATLARELDTINAYERAMHEAGSPEVRRLLAHLRDEEKEHVAECMEYIRRLDEVQDRFFGRDVEAHLAGTDSRPNNAVPEKQSSKKQWSLTVGSLRKT